MIKIKFLSVGKTKEPWLEEGIIEYMKRLSALAQFEFQWFKDERLLEEAIAKEKHVVLLDPHGRSMESIDFAEFFFHEVEKGGSRLTFAIGGAEGFSEAVKKSHSASLLSLSKLTFTHQMTRLILIEQIFRAFEIQKGSGYHK